MRKFRIIDYKELRRLVHYDPISGIFTRRTGRNAGKTIGTKRRGYLVACLNNRTYLLSRLAWLYVTGELPKELIDHINRNPSDNRFTNLRLANDFQQQHNKGKNKNNRSGFKGVSWDKVNNRWRATISANGRASISIGRFNSKKEAHRSYQEMAKKLHGEFASS